MEQRSSAGQRACSAAPPDQWSGATGGSRTMTAMRLSAPASRGARCADAPGRRGPAPRWRDRSRTADGRMSQGRRDGCPTTRAMTATCSGFARILTAGMPKSSPTRRDCWRQVSTVTVITPRYSFELTAMTMWAARAVVKLKLAGATGLVSMPPTRKRARDRHDDDEKVPIWTSQCWESDEWAARWPSGCSTAATR